MNYGGYTQQQQATGQAQPGQFPAHTAGYSGPHAAPDSWPGGGPGHASFHTGAPLPPPQGGQQLLPGAQAGDEDDAQAGEQAGQAMDAAQVMSAMQTYNLPPNARILRDFQALQLRAQLDRWLAQYHGQPGMVPPHLSHGQPASAPPPASQTQHRWAPPPAPQSQPSWLPPPHGPQNSSRPQHIVAGGQGAQSTGPAHAVRGPSPLAPSYSTMPGGHAEYSAHGPSSSNRGASPSQGRQFVQSNYHNAPNVQAGDPRRARAWPASGGNVPVEVLFKKKVQLVLLPCRDLPPGA